VAQSESAGHLELLQEKRPVNDEFDELILQARKRAQDSEETNGQKSKRRHSSRFQNKSTLPELTKPEVKLAEVKETKQAMKKVRYNSLLRHLNQFDSVKLCLKCTVQMCGERGEKAPRGSQIIFEKSFGDMQRILGEAKTKYVGEISQPVCMK